MAAPRQTDTDQLVSIGTGTPIPPPPGEESAAFRFSYNPASWRTAAGVITVPSMTLKFRVIIRPATVSVRLDVDQEALRVTEASYRNNDRPNYTFILNNYTATFLSLDVIGGTAVLRITDIRASIVYEFSFNPRSPGGGVSSTAYSNLQINTSTGERVQPGSPDSRPVPSSTATPSTVLLSIGNAQVCADRPPDGFSPRIIISAKSAAQGRDFGEAFITVIDTIPYNGTYDGMPNQLAPDVWESQFCKFPQFNRMIDSDGVNLMQRFEWLIEHHNIPITLDEFMGRMALFMYSKYILCRLLFGNFSVTYLSSGFHEEFLARLENSEYSEFAVIFKEERYGVVGYNRFFLSAPVKMPCHEKV